jgi:hypothetical protein
LVISENFNKDQGILEPMVSAMPQHIGKPQAKLRGCQNLRPGGLGQALDKTLIAEVVDMYPQVDLFLLCVDRNRDKTRREKLDNMERYIGDITSKSLSAEHAWQVVEVWILAGLERLVESVRH